ncbi:MAG: two-component regulator propeller domain-containing protein [Chitinophagaceae bacterium]
MIYRAGHMLLIPLFIIYHLHSSAQLPGADYNFKHLNVQTGLTQNIVYHFLEDSRGYMWFGTHNGVTLHDGNRAMNFLHDPHVKSSIAGTFITSILEDSSEQVWIGNENGIDRFNRTSFSFTHFGVDRENGEKENTYCVALGFIKANELWFLDTKTKAVRSLNTNSGITTFIAGLNANHASLYKSFPGQTVHIWSAYDKGTIHQVYKEDRLFKEETFFDGKNKTHHEPELVVFHALQQSDSTVWLSTNKGLVKLNPLSNKYKIFDSWQDQTVRELRYTVVSDKGQLWAGSGPDGIFVFDTKTNQFINNFRNDKFDPYTICSDNIVSLYLDKMGNLWCGSFGNGISYTNTKSSFFASHISKKEMSAWKGNNHVSLLGSDLKGNLWCTFQNIIGIGFPDKNFKIRQYRPLLTEDGTLYNQSIYKLLFETNDEAWVATNKGLFRYNLKSNMMRSVPYELLSEEVQGSIWIKDIIRLNDGSVLFSTFAGLYHMTNPSGKPLIKPLNFLNPGAYNGFGKLCQDKQGLLYVKSLTDFIYILRPASKQHQFELVKSIDFMPEVNQFFNYENDSLLYIASDNGLHHINTNSLVLEKDGFDDRLPFISISSFFRKDEKFWLFGEKGLYCYDKKKKQSQAFNMEDGLPANDFTLSALVVDNAGRCVTGTSNGLVSFFPSDVQFITNMPRVQRTALYINDILDTLHGNPDEIKTIHLGAKQSTFSFDFSPVSFFHADQCSFEYKLEGYDENWIKSGATKYTRYSKVPPGKYSFMLRVLDNQGKISPYNKVLEIEIAKSFWQTTLFKAFALAFIALVAWLFSRWYLTLRIRKQKLEFEKQQAIERERTRIATDMHDDLGAGLSRIKFISQSITSKKPVDDVIKTELEKITTYSDEMSEKMGEIVWALNEKNDTLADLIAYSRSYANEYLANHNIECKAKTPLGLPGTFIAGEIRRNIFLSVKECLHNIVKHSGATSVNFSVELGHMIRITIHDNGKGIDWDNKRVFSNGLQNIRQRMNDVKGEVKFCNEQGTKVVLTIPL